MGGMYELLVFLFSSSEMMLTVVTKVLIVDTLRKQHQLIILPAQNFKSDIPNMMDHSEAGTSLSTVPQWRERSMSNVNSQSRVSSPSLDDDYSLPAENVRPPLFVRKTSDFTKVPSRQTYSYANITQMLNTSQITQFSAMSLVHIEERALNLSVGVMSTPTENTSVRNNNRQAGKSGIEKKVSWYVVLDQVCTYLPWIVIGPLYGAWSDRHGRKPLLLLPAAFHVLAVLVYMLVALWPGQLLALILLGGLLRGFCGKHTMFTTAMYCMVSDVVSHEEMSGRFARLLGSHYIGNCLGTLGAGILLEYFRLSCPFLLASALQAVCFFLVLVAVKETFKSPPMSPENTSISFISIVKSAITTLRHPEPREDVLTLDVNIRKDECSESSPMNELEKRGSKSLLCTLLIILALMFLMQWLWSSQREISVQTVSLPPFEWPKSWYGYLYAAMFAVAGIAATIVVPLVVRRAPPGSEVDVYVMVMALLCAGSGFLWTGLAVTYQSDWQIFASNALVAVGLASNSACRAMVSKSLSSSSQATAQAGLCVLENMAKLLGPLFHTTVFVAAFSFSSGLVHFLMSTEAFLTLGMVMSAEAFWVLGMVMSTEAFWVLGMVMSTEAFWVLGMVMSTEAFWVLGMVRLLVNGK